MSLSEKLIAWDHSVLLWINSFSREYEAADIIIRAVAENHLLKGVFIFMLFWGLWFSVDKRKQSRLLALVIVSIVAICVGRLLAWFTPFRHRPLHTQGLDVELPIGMPSSMLETWSAFPSDHAVFFFALATGLYLINRWVGVVAFIHAVAVVLLPRMYLGLHFPSDILAGAIVGSTATFVFLPRVSELLMEHDVVRYAIERPAMFFGMMFLITSQAATMFDKIREILVAVIKAGRLLLL